MNGTHLCVNEIEDNKRRRKETPAVDSGNKNVENTIKGISK